MRPPRAEHTDQAGERWISLTADGVRGYLARHLPLFLGYREARCGEPFDPDAYADDHAAAIRYEEGRRLHALCLAAGIAPPAWDEPPRPPRALVSLLVAAEARL
jgi:hypothetical protein